MVGLSTALLEEARRYNVRVSAICPGVITTNIVNATDSRDFDLKKMHASSPVNEVPVTKAVATILKEVASNKAKIVFPRDIKITTKSYAILPGAYSFLSQLGLKTVLKQK